MILFLSFPTLAALFSREVGSSRSEFLLARYSLSLALSHLLLSRGDFDKELCSRKEGANAIARDPAQPETFGIFAAFASKLKSYKLM